MTRASLFLVAAAVAACSRAAPPAPVAPLTVPIASVAPPAPAPPPVVGAPRSEEPREATLEPLAGATCIVHDTNVKGLPPLIHYGSASRRSFPEWAMKLVGWEHAPTGHRRALLERHAGSMGFQPRIWTATQAREFLQELALLEHPASPPHAVQPGASPSSPP